MTMATEEMTPCPNCGRLTFEVGPCTLCRKSLMRINAEKDSAYRPYCLRCRNLVRMRIVEPFLWKCDQCGAVHDERVQQQG